MTNREATGVLVILNVAPELESTVVDWLLERAGASGFTSVTVFGHSTSHAKLSIAEQVSGRQRRQQFQVQISADSVPSFLSDARDKLGTADIRYWVLPVAESGRLGEVGSAGD